MKPLFKNKTTLSKKNYMSLLKFHQSKNNWKYWVYTAFFSVLFIICIIFQIVAKNYLISILIFLLFLTFLTYRFFFPTYKAKKELHSSKIQNNLVNYYMFFEKYFKIKNQISTAKIKYHKLYKAYNNNDYFYLYIDKNNAFIIEKTGFLIGDAKSFEKFMKRKLGIKWKK